MSRKLAATVVIVLFVVTSVSAHRVDEYLQATILSVEKDHVQAFMRLTPGIAVSSVVLASIDANADGVISEAEKQAYAERVLGDLSLTVDGNRLKPRLVSISYPEIEEMKEGLGEIQMELTADLPVGSRNRRLIFENHHQSRISAFLVNCLTPHDRDIRVIAQNRNEQQSFYQLDYVQAGGHSEPLYLKWRPGVRGWVTVAAATLPLFAVAILVFRGARKRGVTNRIEVS